jgi:hypothetical protein
MKKILWVFAVMIGLNVSAQSEKYVSAMSGTLAQLKDAKDAATMEELVAKLDRIGDAEKTEWLPFYYAALTKARMSFQKMGDADKLADEAALLLAKAEMINPKNSEVLCVKSMIASAKLVVDPQSRWQEYGAASKKSLDQAKKADSTNPRPYVLQAMGLKGMPEQFGGGCANAKPVAEKAIVLFATFKPASEISPKWGKELVDDIITSCK